MNAIVWDEELEEVQGCGGGRQLLSRTWIREGRGKKSVKNNAKNSQTEELKVRCGLTCRHNYLSISGTFKLIDFVVKDVSH